MYVLHGTGEHAGRYEPLASALAEAGWQVGAHDHPGHGQSSGQRGLIHPAGALATQAAIQIQSFARETGATPIVFGHSLGGLLATELVILHQMRCRALVLSAPALAPIMSLTDKLKLRLLSAVAPRLCLDLGYDATTLTHDPDVQAEAMQDKLIHSFKSATLLNWLVETGREVQPKASGLDIPVLLLIAGSDPIVDSARTRAFAEGINQRLITSIEYEGYYHELLNETPERRQRVLRDICVWLDSLDGQGDGGSGGG